MTPIHGSSSNYGPEKIPFKGQKDKLYSGFDKALSAGKWVFKKGNEKLANPKVMKQVDHAKSVFTGIKDQLSRKFSNINRKDHYIQKSIPIGGYGDESEKKIEKKEEAAQSINNDINKKIDSKPPIPPLNEEARLKFKADIQAMRDKDKIENEKKLLNIESQIDINRPIRTPNDAVLLQKKIKELDVDLDFLEDARYWMNRGYGETLENLVQNINGIENDFGKGIQCTEENLKDVFQKYGLVKEGETYSYDLVYARIEDVTNKLNGLVNELDKKIENFFDNK